MGHQGLALAATLLLAGMVGCNASVELPDDPAATDPASSTTLETTSGHGGMSTPAEPANPAKPHIADSVGVNYGGAIAGAHRHAEDMAASITFKKAIDLNYASAGEYPRSHEEFMKREWNPLQTQWPDIKEGYKWQYDPSDHTVKPVPIESETAAATE